MNKTVPFFIVVIALILIASWYFNELQQQQNRKINGLAYGLSGLQSGVEQNQFTAQVALQENHELKQTVKTIMDFSVQSEPEPDREPIGFKRQNNG
jgi:hypothetical protein